MSLITALRSGRQADPDGVEVTISREAVEVAAATIENLEAKLAEARRQLGDCAPFLKEGETPAERIQRERLDGDALMILLVRARRARDALRAALRVVRQRVENGMGELLTCDIIDAALAKNPAPTGGSTAPRSSDADAPVVGGTEFHVWAHSGDEIDFVSQVCGPRETALSEARHYAMQVVNEGTVVVIEEVTRREVERFNEPPVV